MARSPGSGIFTAMARKYPKPIFKPRELKKLLDSQWFVEAERPDGTVDQTAGPFASDSEARDWIVRKSKAWLDSRN
jgi:hypothetical protein